LFTALIVKKIFLHVAKAPGDEKVGRKTHKPKDVIGEAVSEFLTHNPVISEGLANDITTWLVEDDQPCDLS